MTWLIVHLFEPDVSVSSVYFCLCTSTLDNQCMKGEWMTQLFIHLLELVISVSSIHACLCTSTLDKQRKESG